MYSLKSTFINFLFLFSPNLNSFYILLALYYLLLLYQLRIDFQAKQNCTLKWSLLKCCVSIIWRDGCLPACTLLYLMGTLTLQIWHKCPLSGHDGMIPDLNLRRWCLLCNYQLNCCVKTKIGWFDVICLKELCKTSYVPRRNY